MKFTKDFLQDLAYDQYDIDHITVIEDELTDSSRWTLHYRMVFKLDGKFYESSYSTGATEQQDEIPYEWEDDVIDCHEVVPQEVTVIKYVRKEY